jgi:hypothetical protein
VSAEELTLDQKLIVACYRVDVKGVVQYLRAGAKVGATFGEVQEDVDHPLMDRWDGGTPVAGDSWTPLMAVAIAPEYPEPPQAFPRIWENPAQVRIEQGRIGKKALQERRAAELTILCILLSHGADINLADSRGGTPLHMAVDSEKTLLVRTMLQFGANPNTKSHIYIDGPDDITPLHDACTSKELVQLLLDYGANASAKDSEGRTPADWVALDASRDFDLVATPDGPRVRARDKVSQFRCGNTPGTCGEPGDAEPRQLGLRRRGQRDDSQVGRYGRLRRLESAGRGRRFGFKKRDETGTQLVLTRVAN